jgi:putative hydrolase of the HAD superfamily
MDIEINKKSVIVFDLDDTLYNEIEYLKSAYRAIAIFLDKENWKFLYSKMFSLYRSEENVFSFLEERYEVEKNYLINMYRNHTPEIHLFNNVLEILESIKAKGGKLGIITDGRSNTQLAKIKALGIEKLFDEIIISETIGSEKPSVLNYKSIEKALKGSEYYYIADNFKKDFVTPNAIGWKTIGLTDNGLNIHRNTHLYCDELHKPQLIIESFKEIVIL